MRLTPTERDRLLIFTAAQLARSRRDRGLLLNVPETTALISDAVCEAAREGRRLSEAVEIGRGAVSADDVLPGVAEVVTDVWVEAVFDDGSRLVVVPDPVGAATTTPTFRPGAIDSPHDEIEAGPSETVEIEVENTADVPISVTSHFHFFEVNPRLRFDRSSAFGQRLAIESGSTVRFEPHSKTTVTLTPIAGSRTVIGFSGLVDGPLDAPGAREQALERARATGFLDSGESR